MAAKKSSKKKAGKSAVKKKASKKAASKKKSAAKRKAAPKKKVASKKKATSKKASTKKASAAGKSEPAKKASGSESKEAVGLQESLIKTRPDSAKQPASAKKAPEGISSMSVNVGHVFALKPRVTTAYRQADFLAAKHLLRDDSFASIQEAARAVVEKALELTRGGAESPRVRDR